MQQFVKTLIHIPAKTHPQIRLDVAQKRPYPVLLPLTAETALVPYPVLYPVTQTAENNPYRHMMPRPVPKRPYRIHTSAISTNVTPQTEGCVVPFKICIYKPMFPYSAASAALFQTIRRPREFICPANSENLLDTNHEKKRQYPHLSGNGGGISSIKR